MTGHSSKRDFWSKTLLQWATATSRSPPTVHEHCDDTRHHPSLYVHVTLCSLVYASPIFFWWARATGRSRPTVHGQEQTTCLFSMILKSYDNETLRTHWSIAESDSSPLMNTAVSLVNLISPTYKLLPPKVGIFIS